tara:strand:+ start:151 stop:1431 length:1281 start_codon:yes stop_codon:yes gene_type:complete
MFLKKIKNKKFIVGVIGLGYVGLPRVLQFCDAKIKVIGFDVDKEKILKLKKYKSYLTNVSSKKIKKALNNNFFIPTDNFQYIKNVDVIIICLPTPLKNGKIPDLSFIKNTFNKIKKYLRTNQILCLESTSYPETTKEIFEKSLKKKFKLGINFFLAYSPERNDPGLSIKMNSIPKIVSGYSPTCLNLIEKVYKKIFKKIIKVSSIEIAEMTKIYENVYRAINIGFANEMKKICSKMKLDINEIIKAAKSKPFGFKAFYPGPGLGGHCIPIDPFYLSWKAKKKGINTEFINLAGKINKSMPSWVLKKLNKNLSKKVNKILILGIAYKKNINDCRESPAFEMIKILKKNKNKVDYSDPFISKIPKLRKYNFQDMESKKINKKILQSYDAVILVTDHDNFDYELIKNNSKLIVDTRSRYTKQFSNVIFA